MVDYVNNNLAIEAGWLIDQGITSKDNYDAYVKRHKIRVVRRGCRNTPAMIDYESMPDRFKRAVVEKLGRSPYQDVKKSQIEINIEHDAKLSQYFDDYSFDNGRRIPKETRLEYYTNAIVLKAIHKMLGEKRAMWKAKGKRFTAKWDVISEGCQELDRKLYDHTLPANARRLQEKYSRFVKDGPGSLIHKNFTNKNAAKIDDEVKESVLAELLADPRNFDNAQVMRFYNTMANMAGWKPITEGTVAMWRDRFESKIYAGRRGSVAFSNKKAMHVKRSAPTNPLYFWTMDGWDVELLFQKTEVNKKTGYSNTTYHHRPTVVIVLDAYNKYPVGYAIGLAESPQLIREALRNAAKHTQELFGAMYRTHQIQSDRYAISNLTPYYEIMAKHSTPARAKNAKAKIIEPYFKSLNKKYCQLQPNWSGFGIQSNKESQPNTEYLNTYKKNFPEFEGVCDQIVKMIEAERAEKREQYIVQFNKMADEDKIEFKRENFLLAFGQRTDRKNMLQDNGIKVTIEGIKRDYDCFDLSFRDHYSTRWEIRYDPQDLTTVLAVNEDETLRYILEEKYVQPMALKDRKPGDSGQLQRVRDFNNLQVEQTKMFRAKNIENMSQVVPIMLQNETLSKLMLTDSHGQHKDRRNDQRRTKDKNEMTPKARFKSLAQDVDNEESSIFDMY